MYSSRGNISLKSQHYKKIVANGRRIALASGLHGDLIEDGLAKSDTVVGRVRPEEVPKEISRLTTSVRAGLSASNNEAVGSQKPLKQRGAKIATISASNKESISHSMRFFDF